MFSFLIIIFILLFTGFYLFLQGSLIRTILGVLFISNAANLIIFKFTGLVSNHPPLILGDQKILSGNYSDPLPQALILTAIVIGFGLVIFLTFLSLRTRHHQKGDALRYQPQDFES